MRTLTPALIAAVNATTRQPCIRLSAEDHINHLQQTINTAGNTDTWHDACVASDGSIVRVQVQGGGSIFATSFRWQRITDPTSAAQWSAWNTFAGGSGNMYLDGGCAISNNGGVLHAFAQQGSGGNAIFAWTSSDNGQTWSAVPAVVLSPPGGALCKGIASAGNNEVFFLYEVFGGDQIGCSFYTGSSWSALHTSTLPTLPSIPNHSGLAVAWNAAASLYTVIYSDFTALHAVTTSAGATTWARLPDVIPATNQNTLRLSPRLTFFENLYHLICIEADNGTYTGTVYQYPRVRQSADLLHWSSGFILHDLPSYYGACFLKTTPPAQSRARYIAATLSTVTLGLDYQASDSIQYADLSARILSYRREEQAGRPARLTLTLDNADPALTSLVASYHPTLTYAPIGLNTTLVLDEGYFAGSPPIMPETITTARYRVTRVVFERMPGSSRLHVEAEDLTRLLDAVNRYQVTYTNQSLAWMITEICARAGLFNIVLPATSQMSNSVITFVLHAGQRYRQALDELCHLGWLEYFLDQNETLQFRELPATDPIVWSYTPEIEMLTLGSDAERANHVIVSGRPPATTGTPPYSGALTNGEAYDDAHMHISGLERLIMVSDPRLTSASQCAARAAFILAQEQRSQLAHSVTVPVNPALQLLDVVQLNDQATPRGTGLSATARIYRSEVAYDAEKGMYEMKLYLEGV
ncbi:MAG: hypothetical protein IMW89_17860 [Ktedonobacteraceae bacterium]|nr:hypothetical protein [Ktedonobacteraceae bacterium]